MKFSCIVIALLLGCLAGLCLAEDQKVDYTGHKVVRIHARTDIERAALADLLPELESMGQSIYKQTREWADIRFDPVMWQKLSPVLPASQLEIIHEDLGAHLEQERANSGPWAKGMPTPEFFTQWRNRDSFLNFTKTLAEDYPSLVSEFSIGTSYEGRDIFCLRVGAPTSGEKQVLFFNGGIHAREWLSPMTMAYLAWRFADDYQTNENVQTILSEFDIEICPISNPDGYLYTWNSDRMWRKNRQPNNSPCYGTDLNRNFPFHWGGPGASTNPCSETYRGASEASGTEVQRLTDYVASLGNVAFFVDYHCYGGYVLTPWGDTATTPPNYVATRDLGYEVRDLIESMGGPRYIVGNSYTAIYPTSGGSNDWAYGQEDIYYAWAMECRGNSFAPPLSSVLPNCEETYAAAKLVANHLLTK